MRILYGGRTLYDPDSGVELLDVELVTSLRAASSLSFRMQRTHSAYGAIALESVAPQIEVWDGNDLVMQGRAYSCEDVDDIGTVEYQCEGELAYLNDVSVRPYSTVSGAAPLLAPADPYGYFNWLIDNYNARVEPAKRFTVGVNHGNMLKDTAHILREDSTYPSCGKVISEKLLDGLGGFVRARYEGRTRYIDYLADTDGVASQRIEFGANLLKFARTRDGSPIYSAVIPLGKKPDNTDRRLTISSLGNGDADGYGRYVRQGDVIKSVDLIAKVGYRECAVVWDEVTTAGGLQSNALSWLPGQAHEIETIKVNAFDLSRIDPGTRRINLGDYVRVTSKPNGYDSYMIVSKITYRPTSGNPAEYTFGLDGDDIGDVVRKHAQTLNASINGAYDAMAPIGQAAKDAAKKADAAVVSSFDEYAVSSSSIDPPETGWSTDTPEWTDGNFIWRRAVTSYGDGTTVEGVPACMTGNAGASGEDATVVLIDSSNGNAFKNNSVSTTLRAIVFHGANRITTIDALKAEYGSTARIEWSWQRLGEGRFGAISADDARLSESGMALTISPADVDEKTNFAVDLKTD